MNVIELADLVVLCANCHRIVHAKREWRTMGELKDLVRATEK